MFSLEIHLQNIKITLEFQGHGVIVTYSRKTVLSSDTIYIDFAAQIRPVLAVDIV